jgi:hypothetical protein
MDDSPQDSLARESPDALRARFVFGQMRLIDLWQVSQLEGLMTLNGVERFTADLVDDNIEFLGSDGIKFMFPATTEVALAGTTGTFAGEIQHGKGPAYTLEMNRQWNPLGRVS